MHAGHSNSCRKQSCLLTEITVVLVVPVLDGQQVFAVLEAIACMPMLESPTTIAKCTDRLERQVLCLWLCTKKLA